MKSSKSLEPLLEPIKIVQDIILQFGGQGMVIGGIAASMLGQPRFTADVDVLLLIPGDKIPELVKVAEQKGLRPRIPDVIEFARKNRVVLLTHPESSIHIDLILGLLPFEIEAVDRAREYDLGSVRIRLPTPEDLIIFKAVAHRPKDLFDIEAIAFRYPNLDKERIYFWVRQFASLLEMPELLSDVEDILERRG